MMLFTHMKQRDVALNNLLHRRCVATTVTAAYLGLRSPYI